VALGLVDVIFFGGNAFAFIYHHASSTATMIHANIHSNNCNNHQIVLEDEEVAVVVEEVEDNIEDVEEVAVDAAAAEAINRNSQEAKANISIPASSNSRRLPYAWCGSPWQLQQLQLYHPGPAHQYDATRNNAMGGSVKVARKVIMTSGCVCGPCVGCAPHRSSQQYNQGNYF